MRSTEVPPQMFREGIGVVVEGTFDKSQVFSSNRLMVNHSNEYRAPKPGEEPRKWQETLSEGSTTAAQHDGGAVNATIGYGLVLGGAGVRHLRRRGGPGERPAPQRGGLRRG